MFCFCFCYYYDWTVIVQHEMAVLKDDKVGKGKHFALGYARASEVIILPSMWCVVSFQYKCTSLLPWHGQQWGQNVWVHSVFRVSFVSPRHCVVCCIPAFRHVPHSWLISMECEVFLTCCASLLPIPLLSRITHLLPSIPLPEPKHS